MPDKANNIQGEVPEWLAKLKAEAGFRVPDMFFENFAEETEDRIALDQAGIPQKSDSEFSAPEGHLKQMRENLKKHTGQSGNEEKLSVPEGFFEQMQKDINQRIEQESAPAEVSSGKHESGSTIVSISRWKKVLIPMSAAAAILAAVFIWNSTDEECETFACLLENTEIGYDDLDYFTSQELEEFLEEDSPEEGVSTDDEELLDYLIENEIDIEDLLEDYE